jgi:hypothetical protein
MDTGVCVGWMAGMMEIEGKKTKWMNGWKGGENNKGKLQETKIKLLSQKNKMKLTKKYF